MQKYTIDQIENIMKQKPNGTSNSDYVKNRPVKKSVSADLNRSSYYHAQSGTTDTQGRNWHIPYSGDNADHASILTDKRVNPDFPMLQGPLSREQLEQKNSQKVPVLESKFDKYLTSGYKMSATEKKEAAQYADDWLKNYNADIRSGVISQAQAARDMSDSSSAYAKMIRLRNKASSGSAFLSGIMDSALNFPGVKNVSKRIDDISGGKSSYGFIRDSIEDAGTQSPVAQGLGNIGMEMAKYNVAGQMMSSIPQVQAAKGALSGRVAGLLSTGGNAVAAKAAGMTIPALIGDSTANVLSDLTLDTALDTIPYLLDPENKEDSFSGMAGKALRRTGYNLGMNVLGETFPYALKGVSGIAKNSYDNIASKRVGQAVEATSDALKQDDILRQLDPLGSLENNNSVVESVVKDADKGKSITDPVEKAFMSGDVSKTHTKEEIEQMYNYLKSSDYSVVEYAEQVREAGKSGYVKPFELKSVSDRAASDIKRITGIDATGNRVVMDKSTIQHIDGDHGIHGKSDHSMADDMTLSRIQYVLDNYDNAIPGKGTKKLQLRNGAKSPTVVFEKKIDGTYYVVEAVTDAKTKTNNIVSAYTQSKSAVDGFDISKEVAYPMANADIKSPSPYGQTGSEFTTNFKIPESSESVNGRIIADLEIPDLSVLDNKINSIALDSATDGTAQELARDAKMNLQMYANGSGSAESLRKSIQKLNDYLTGTGKNYNLEEDLYGLMGNIQKATGNSVNMDVDLNARTKTSKSATNTFRNTEVFKSIDGASDKIEAGIKDGEFKYNPTTERESVRAAAAALEKNAVSEEYRLKTTTWTNGSRDTDEAMMILEQKFKDAVISGDSTEAMEFARTMSAQIRNQAQGLQAMAKYSRTSTGTLMKAQTLIDEGIDDWIKNNPKQANQVRDFAEDLMHELDNLSQNAQNPLTPLEPGTVSMDDIVSAVKKKVQDAGLGNRFDQSNIEKIAEMLSRGTDVNKIEDTVESIMALGWPGLDDDTIQQVTDIFNDAAQYGEDSMQRVNAENKAYALLAEKIISPTWQDKWNTWRYFSMLANPTTHERNMIGNLAMNVVSQVKDAIGSGMESVANAVSKNGIDRTKTVLNPLSTSDKALKKAAGEDAVNEVYRQLSGGSKYNVTRGIESQAKAFDGKVTQYIQKLADMNSSALEKEDWLGLKAKYSQSLAGYLKANGADASIFKATDDASKSLLNKARSYAISQAQEVTFHEDSAIASALSQFSENLNNSGTGGKVASAIIEGVMPFKKTPINILKEGGRYSPLGIARGLQKTASALKTGKYTASEAIESLSKGLTGTGIMALGAYLGSKGIIRGTGTGDDAQDTFDEMQGAQDYSIVFGDKSYTIDWLTPSALPLMVGVQLQQEFSDGVDASDLIRSIAGIADPIVETSFMSGIQSALEAVQYAEDGEQLQTIVGNTLAGYAAQGVPTVAGKVTRAFDNTRRSNLTENTGFLGQLEYQYNRARAKLPAVGEDIPVLSDQNPEYVDAWGRTQQNFQGSDNTLANLAYQMLSPGYYSKRNTTEVDTTLQTLYDGTGDTGVLPKKLERTMSGQRLSAEDYTAAQKDYGSRSYELLNEMLFTDTYSSMSLPDQAELVQKIYSFSKGLTQNEMFGKELSSENQKLKTIYNDLGADGLARYYLYKKQADADGNGSLSKMEVVPFLNAQELTNGERALYYSYMVKGNNPYQ